MRSYIRTYIRIINVNAATNFTMQSRVGCLFYASIFKLNPNYVQIYGNIPLPFSRFIVLFVERFALFVVVDAPYSAVYRVLSAVIDSRTTTPLSY